MKSFPLTTQRKRGKRKKSKIRSSYSLSLSRKFISTLSVGGGGGGGGTKIMILYIYCPCRRRRTTECICFSLNYFEMNFKKHFLKEIEIINNSFCRIDYVCVYYYGGLLSAFKTIYYKIGSISQIVFKLVA